MILFQSNHLVRFFGILALMLFIIAAYSVLNNDPDFIPDVPRVYENKLTTVVIYTEEIADPVILSIYDRDINDMRDRIERDLSKINGKVLKREERTTTIVAPSLYLDSLMNLNTLFRPIPGIATYPLYAEWHSQESIKQYEGGPMMRFDLVFSSRFISPYEGFLILSIFACMGFLGILLIVLRRMGMVDWQG